MIVKFKRLYPSAIAPTKAHDTDAGFDLYVHDFSIEWAAGSSRIVAYRAGIAIEIPPGYFGMLVPRSSVYATSQVLSNSVGIIDAGYRGEIIGRFMWPYRVAIEYKRRERFAQLLILPLPAVELVEADELSPSQRGQGGFGSSGK